MYMESVDKQHYVQSILHYRSEFFYSDLIWLDKGVVVTKSVLRQVCQSLRELQTKKNRAARLILTRAEVEIPAQQGGKFRQRLRKVFLSEGRSYYAELKTLAQNPKHLQQLLEATQSLILYCDPDKGTVTDIQI